MSGPDTAAVPRMNIHARNCRALSELVTVATSLAMGVMKQPKPPPAAPKTSTKTSTMASEVAKPKRRKAVKAHKHEDIAMASVKESLSIVGPVMR